MTTQFALVDENNTAVNDERFATSAEAYQSATGSSRGPRRLANGQPMLLRRTVWVAPVGADGKAILEA